MTLPAGPPDPLGVSLDPELAEVASMTGNAGTRARAVVAIEAGQSLAEAARVAGVRARTVRSWLRKYELFGAHGLLDPKRPGRPAKPAAAAASSVAALHARGLSTRGIALRLGISQTTVRRKLRVME